MRYGGVFLHRLVSGSLYPRPSVVVRRPVDVLLGCGGRTQRYERFGTFNCMYVCMSVCVFYQEVTYM